MIESDGMKCIKFTIFAFNFVFVLAACGLIGFGIYIQVQHAEYFDFFGNQLPGPGTVLIVIGVFIFIVTTFGCYGALKENYRCIMTFAVLMGVIIIIQIAAPATSFIVYRGEVQTKSAKLLMKAMSYYGKKEAGSLTEALDKLQQQLECCGANTYSDWYTILTPKLVPTSCCIVEDSTQCENRTQTLNETDFHIQGCATALSNLLKDESLIVIGVIIALVIVQVVGIILACCLGKAIRKEYKVL